MNHYALPKFVLINIFIDIYCDYLQKWLTEKGYSKKLLRKEILNTRTQRRETLLDKEKMSRNDNRVTFNIMCSPVFKTPEIF